MTIAPRPRTGKLIAVVGPSGAGKDTLIDAARMRLDGDARILFPRRIVTRPPSAAEDHDTLSDAAFARAEAEGGFSLSWHAHGLGYGLPLALRDMVRSGVHAVCNLSRSSIADARQNFPAVAVVLVTAPAEVIAARLAARGRESADLIRARLARRIDREDALGPDLIITNDGPVEAAIDRLVAYLRAELVDTAYPEAPRMPM
ncbi:phosphonate metabolism protein/1,5-bisphosphokinase (PRPP-forming) PhnN [Labrys monachus]|uniref:Ribose 1,5-bisphosphate phosphokinase PhnN n=1 Tax=Labrys monachus TaxID=217067 RepID=A0ABU0FJL8_9HYPH|nr:phosphonate metabolism protein/1,5-bisphosphokinase (PRPP-forming) PhnN [Labrys monachus]MDQ0394681.1 ribose 1,5-bisphosphokinase [Labrys monachus]